MHPLHPSMSQALGRGSQVLIEQMQEPTLHVLHSSEHLPQQEHGSFARLGPGQGEQSANAWELESLLGPVVKFPVTQ